MFGYPNITGWSRPALVSSSGTGGFGVAVLDTRGAFYNGQSTVAATCTGGTDVSNVGQNVCLDAHRYNTVYNTGASVIPKSLIFNHAIKS